MNRLLVYALLAVSLSAADPAYSDEAIADAIYRAEGGAKARVPYGILSVRTHGEADARRICLNTIRNNRKRWEKAGKPGEYLDFLANRYCPPSADPLGNKRWKANVRGILAQ